MKISVKLFLILIFSVSYGSIYCQQKKKPKLIVGIVVDQMRSEYLYRFQDNYTENGFKRLMREGFNVKNTHYNYIPTATGPGHASIYTGATPTNHGIIANNWYSRNLKRKMYCAEDSTVFLVDNQGIEKSKGNEQYSRSPKNLMTTTITDELKLFTNERSKIIGISLKDRGAIFPAGHLADAAYWYNSSNGNFVTSSYYKEELPKWLQNFNNQQKADSLLNLTWNSLLPMKNYNLCGLDDAPFEKKYIGKEANSFPYNLKKIRNENGNFALLSETPFGNSLLTQLAIATIKEEQLGKGYEIDFLTISYSSTDYVGHNFGIRSKELEDTYVRMDLEIASVLEILDNQIGKDNYLLFLTADHGASDNSSFLESLNLSGKFFSSKKIGELLNNHLSKEFGVNTYISFIDKTQIYLAETETPKEEVEREAMNFLKTIGGIKEVFIPENFSWNLNNSNLSTFIKNAYNPKESGDIIYHMYPGWMEQRAYGTTHGNAYNSDTHVPLLFYGWHIPHGETVKYYEITQISPTLSFLLNIPLPNTSTRNAILEIFE